MKPAAPPTDVALAEERARATLSAARERIAAKGLDRAVAEADAAVIKSAHRLAELRSDLVQAAREGRVIGWPGHSRLRTFAAVHDALEARLKEAEGLLELEMSEANRAGQRLTTLLAVAQVAGREAKLTAAEVARKGRTRKAASEDRKLAKLIGATFRRWANMTAPGVRRWAKDNEHDPAAKKLGNVSLPRLRRVLAAMKKEGRV